MSIAALSDSSKSGKSAGSGVNSLSLRVWSHWPAKFSARARDLGSRSIRLTWARRLSRRRSDPWAARRKSSSSGMLLQRKYESREARSKSLIRQRIARRAAVVILARHGRGNGARPARPGARAGSPLRSSRRPSRPRARSRAIASARRGSRAGGTPGRRNARRMS